jgi:lipoic acid synthetase
VLIPDFQGNPAALLDVVHAKPELINHNIETVERLYPFIRPEADYRRSLRLLAMVKEYDSSIKTKSGIMVGLGEEEEEIISAMKHLRAAHCDMLTIGQYLAPSRNHFPVHKYIHPSVFNNYKKIAYNLGFQFVASGPFVRSSYHAKDDYTSMLELEKSE